MHRFYLLTVFVMTCLFCCVWQNIQVVKVGQVITAHEKTLEDLSFHKRALELKVASLTSLDRLQEVSKELGLDVGEKHQTIYVQEVQTMDFPKPSIAFKESPSFLSSFMASLTSIAEAKPLRDRDRT